jgi:tRNA (guanine37-N1)-methyltransferase
MRFDILTIFPEMFASPLGHSILKRARDSGLLQVRFVDPRDFTDDIHRSVDDSPYGGGAGMVMKAEPIFRAVESLAGGEMEDGAPDAGPDRIVLLTPQGETFSQARAREFASVDHLVLICGRYEGIDERVREHLVTDEISIGDFVLTGGELPAMVVLDAVARLLPGVLGHQESASEESFSEGLLEYPHYTRPAVFRGWPVPDVLLSGHHGQVREWRRRQSLLRTMVRRPDLFRRHALSEEDLRLLGLEPPKRKRRRDRGSAWYEKEAPSPPAPLPNLGEGSAISDPPPPLPGLGEGARG